MTRKKKTIICKTCGAEISLRAKRCPFCGEMTPGKWLEQIVTGVIFAPFIAIVILISLAIYFGWFSYLFWLL